MFDILKQINTGVLIKEKVNARIFMVLAMALMQAACVTPASIQPNDLRDFKSDACTAYPEGTPDNPAQWEHCCRLHDKYYWAGGVRQSRSQADAILRQCVVESGASTFRARMIWLGVRLGGTPLLPTSFRWSYGWPYYRGYKAITPQEQLQIEQHD